MARRERYCGNAGEVSMVEEQDSITMFCGKVNLGAVCRKVTIALLRGRVYIAVLRGEGQYCRNLRGRHIAMLRGKDENSTVWEGKWGGRGGRECKNCHALWRGQFGFRKCGNVYDFSHSFGEVNISVGVAECTSNGKLRPAGPRDFCLS